MLCNADKFIVWGPDDPRNPAKVVPSSNAVDKDATESEASDLEVKKTVKKAAKKSAKKSVKKSVKGKKGPGKLTYSSSVSCRSLHRL